MDGLDGRYGWKADIPCATLRTMWRLLMLVGILEVTAGCTPVRTTIENDTGAAVQVEIVATSGKLIAKGTIPAGTGLDLEDQLASISVIRYAHDRKSCVLSGAAAQADAVSEHGTNNVHLRGC